MTDLQEKAMKMALEALDYHFDNVDVDAYWPYVLEAKQALRQALAHPEQEPMCASCNHNCNQGRDCPARSEK